jgi:perosamine synthetase
VQKHRRIPVAGPSITEKEIEYVTDAVTRAWYDDANIYHERFETAFATYVNRAFALALPSCTSALHLSLLRLGVGPGDEVIIPDTTWIASSAPISYVGAEPVFVDIDADSWCIDVDALEQALTPQTKAVIVVDLYGNMPELDAIVELLERHGVPLIEDAAEAIGSEYRGSRAGRFGLTSTFSFHGSKTLTTGEGGMLVTDDEDTYDRCRFLRDHGRNPGDKFFRSTEVAYKYKMSSMQAALGLAQLERMDELLGRKREIFSWYRDAIGSSRLGREDLVTLNSEAEGVLNSYWMVTAIVDPAVGVTKFELMDDLRSRGIDSRPFFDPLSSLDAYSDRPQAAAARAKNSTAYALAQTGINLPSALNLTEDDVAFVCGQLADSLGAE